MKNPIRASSRKGFVSTLMVLIVITALFSYTSLYLETQNKETSYFNSLMNQKISYAEDDLIQSYLQSQGITTLRIDVNGQNKTVLNITSDINISTGRDYSTDFQTFKNYFENTYDSYSNYEADINFNEPFTLNPYGTTFNYQGNELYVYTQNYSAIEEMKIVTTAHNGSQLSTTDIPTSDGGGYPLITAIIKSNDGSVLINNSVRQDPADTNTSDDFLCNFRGNKYRVLFGDTGQPGTLYIDGTQVPGTLEKIDIIYESSQEKIFINSTGNYSIGKIQNYTKSTEMMISQVKHR